MPRIPPSVLERLIGAVRELRAHAAAVEANLHEEIVATHPDHRESARNLAHYVALRQRDLRTLQRDLGGLGLSSLGRLEGHTLATLDAVLEVLHQLVDRIYEPGDPRSCVNPRTSEELLAEHSRVLLGPRPMRRSVRIMVTMPSEAARDYGVVRDLLAIGMNIMRINCAHDEPDDWRAMIAHLRQAERELGVTCRVQIDLAGPKLRTGAIAPLARMIKLRPKRGGLGRIETPARLWLTPAAEPEPAPPGIASARVTGQLVVASQEGDLVVVEDARGRKRTLNIVSVSGRSRVAETSQTTYLVEGAFLILRRHGAVVAEGCAEGLPERVMPIVLQVGDTLMLTRADTPGEPARRDNETGTLLPAHIHCTLAGAFDSVAAGDRAYLDDGKIGSVVESNDGQVVGLRITQASGAKGAKLQAEKGINFPDTALEAPCLTPRDLEALEAMAPLVDMVALSFVRRPEDLAELHEHCVRLRVPNMGVVLKVENRAAFENLPRLLLAALRGRQVGVMVARGDLGVEVGFERLSEVQEEILWLSEAAHVPVIWATQVLEELAKTGSPTRAEVTDAAMGGRAECVMLNKGPHIVAAVEFLGGVLERMYAHQSKKTPMLRKLSVSENFA